MARDYFIGITEQLKCGVHRLDEARALFDADRWRGAMYLAGYSIECLLKAKLMQMFNCSNLHGLEEELQRRNLLAANATIFTHQLEVLLRLANGLDRLRQNPMLWPLFNIVNRWIPAWRYNPDLANAEDAEDYLDAVDKIRHWIDNNV
ncbi:MAG: HEPN domain-containing protein [Pirellulaceae bacterium]